MGRPKSGVIFAIDGVTYKTTKPEVCDYLFERLGGATHATASRHLEGAIVSSPLFNIPATATNEMLTKALKSVLVVHSEPKGE